MFIGLRPWLYIRQWLQDRAQHDLLLTSQIIRVERRHPTSGKCSERGWVVNTNDGLERLLVQSPKQGVDKRHDEMGNCLADLSIKVPFQVLSSSQLRWSIRGLLIVASIDDINSEGLGL